MASKTLNLDSQTSTKVTRTCINHEHVQCSRLTWPKISAHRPKSCPKTTKWQPIASKMATNTSNLGLKDSNFAFNTSKM